MELKKEIKKISKQELEKVTDKKYILQQKTLSINLFIGEKL